MAGDEKTSSKENGERRLGGWRRWVFPLATALLVPALLLGALELGLRLAGYGVTPRFFVPVEGLPADAEPAWTTNPRWGWRFFPPALARSPAVCSLPRQKAPGTVRLFVLGGSAAMGTPDSAFGFGRLLEGMLEESFPDTDFEVVNAAVTAVGSHGVLPIAREAARLEPDVFLVYLGNNEVVGPYGPGTVFAGFSDSLAAVRTGIWLRGTRTGQLVSNLAARFGGGGGGLAEWKGMEMFAERRVAEDDPRLEAIYEHLAANLEDILAAAERAGARVVLSTVVTNLVDNPPFASLHREGLAGGELERWQGLFGSARQVFVEGGDEAALRRAAGALEEAAGLDDRHAELHFLLAHAYAELGRGEEAEGHFRRARDLDALRFRADGRVNQVLREVAAGRDGDSVRLLDAETAVPGSPIGAGAEIFWEHVHLNLEGNYRLAAAFYREVTALLASRLGLQEGAAPPEPPSRQRLMEVLALSDRDRLNMARAILEMVSRPPFTAQLGHEERIEQLRGLVRALRLRSFANAGQSAETYRRALEARPEDLALRAHYADFLQQGGEREAAVEQWEELLARVPGVATWRTRRAFALAELGASATGEETAPPHPWQTEAVAELEAVVEEYPGSPEARVNLGTVLERAGDPQAATARYRDALELHPGYELARLNLANLRAEEGDLDGAEELLREALDLDPTSAEAHGRLGGVLERRGDLERAAEEYSRALELDPDLAVYRNNLGYVHERQGKLRQAATEYARAIDSDPGYPLPYFNLADLLLSQGAAAEAVAAYRAALTLAPGNLQARYNLAAALAGLGEEEAAAGEFRFILERVPGHPGALNNLAWILATSGRPEVRDPEEAVGLAERALEAAPGNPQVLETLARAYAAAGRRGEAAEAAGKALEAARAAGDEALLAALEERLRGLR